MRSKREIEQTLEHLQSPECHHHGSRDNEIWIAALTWTLGDDEHKAVFAEWLGIMDTVAEPSPGATSGEKVACIALRQVLDRLR